MNEIRDNREDGASSSKQPYARPELVRHGKVEDQTRQPAPPSTSQPINDVPD